MLNQWQNIGKDITNHLSTDNIKTLCGIKIGKIYNDTINKAQNNVWMNNGDKPNSNPLCKRCKKHIHD